MYCTTIPYKNIILFFLFLCCRVLFAQTIPPPVIYSFFPLSGPVDTTVTIKGDNFSTDPTQNVVYFGAVQAPVVSATTTTLTVTVPAGATYQPITVTTNHLTAYSNTFFNVTFPTNGSGLTTSTFIKKDTDYSTHSYPQSIAISDLNNDSKADIIVSTAEGVQTFINGSSPKMISLNPGQDVTNNNAYFTATGDFNGDGKQDVAVVNKIENSDFTTVSVF